MNNDQYKADLAKEYRKLAKRADQRLVRLERAAENKEHYGAILKWSYAKAVRDIKSIRGETFENPRFNVSMEGKSVRELQSAINKVNAFLYSETSTIGGVYAKDEKTGKRVLIQPGIKQLYIKKSKKMNKKLGVNLTWQQWADFFETGLWDTLDMVYGYKTTMKKLKNATIKKKQEKIKKTVKEFEKNPKLMRVTDDELAEIIEPL